MLHQPHAGVARPALLVVVAHDILVVGVGVLSQIALDQVARLLRREPNGTQKYHMSPVDNTINPYQGTHSNCIFKFPVFSLNFPCANLHYLCDYYIDKTDLADLSTFWKKIFKFSQQILQYAYL